MTCATTKVQYEISWHLRLEMIQHFALFTATKKGKKKEIYEEYVDAMGHRGKITHTKKGHLQRGAFIGEQHS